MATFPVSVADALDKLREVYPNNPAWTGPVDALKGVLNTLPAPPPIAFPVPQWVTDLQNQANSLSQQLLALQQQLASLLSAPPQPPSPPPLAPANPVDVLRDIATGVKTAESILNEVNLVIATGAVETELDVAFGKVAGAHAKIKINLTPKPYN